MTWVRAFDEIGLGDVAEVGLPVDERFVEARRAPAGYRGLRAGDEAAEGLRGELALGRSDDLRGRREPRLGRGRDELRPHLRR
jgi:hypothetical protein